MLHDPGADRLHLGAVVGVLVRLEADRGVPLLDLRARARQGDVQIGHRRAVGEGCLDAADQLQIGSVSSRLGHGAAKRRQLVGGRRPEGMKPAAVAHQPAQHRGAQLHSTEPHARAFGAPRLRLEVGILEVEELSGEARWSISPGDLHRLELFIEDRAAAAKRHSHGPILILMPADGRLDDQAALGEQVERGELVCKQQRMPQRSDDRGQRDSDPLGTRAIAAASSIESGQGVAGS